MNGTIRAGVYMPAMKIAIFDLIEAAGDAGVTASDIMEKIYHNRAPVEAGVIGSHARQINLLLRKTPFVIVIDGRHGGLRFKLEKRKIGIGVR